MRHTRSLALAASLFVSSLAGCSGSSSTAPATPVDPMPAGSYHSSISLTAYGGGELSCGMEELLLRHSSEPATITVTGSGPAVVISITSGDWLDCRVDATSQPYTRMGPLSTISGHGWRLDGSGECRSSCFRDFACASSPLGNNLKPGALEICNDRIGLQIATNGNELVHSRGITGNLFLSLRRVSNGERHDLGYVAIDADAFRR